MFRPMVRKKQQITEAECIEILKNEPRGVLSVLGDEGYPYGLPIDHWYCEEDGNLYFHSGMTGHKVDAMKKHDKASFCVFDEGYRREGLLCKILRSTAKNSGCPLFFGRSRSNPLHKVNKQKEQRTIPLFFLWRASWGFEFLHFAKHLCHNLKLNALQNTSVNR